MENGFNINYAEVVFDAEMRTDIDLFGSLLFSPGGFKMGEVYLNATKLPGGFSIKGGRFLSGIGMLNGQHNHEQNFSDVPLVYFVFFGSDQLLENGLQFLWSVPVQFKLNLGVEVLEGDNSMSYGTAQIGNDVIEIDPSGQPNLYTAFLDTLVLMDTLDIGFSLFGACGESRINNNLQSRRGSAIEAMTFMLGGSLMVKYSYSSFQFISLEGEFLARSMRGDFYEASVTGTEKKKIDNTHYGFYSQLIVQPFARWRVGFRYSMVMGTISSEAESGDDSVVTWSNYIASNLLTASGMIAYTPNSYSRIRLQYNFDMSKYDDELQGRIIHEVILDCTFLFGLHGRFI